MIKPFLTPINVEEPPKHTQLHPRCFTCKKFPVCNLREDYLKTILLIQNILGDPQEDRALFYYNDEWMILPCFSGLDIEEAESYFPANITTETEKNGTFMVAKYRNTELVQFLYKIENYYVLFQANWNEQNGQFDISIGHEVFYNIIYNLSENSIHEINAGLIQWRADEKEKEEERKDMDIINTTYFSAQLNCEFYEWEKGLTELEGIKRLIKEFPEGIPCKDGTTYHLATFHAEPHKVPLYHPENGKVAFAPMPYPVFVPPACKKKKCITRGEQNNGI